MTLVLLLLTIIGDGFIQIYCFECMIFGLKHGHKVIESFQTLQARSRIGCDSLCFRESNCRSASFDKIGGICEFSDQSLNSAEITPKDGYTVFGNSKFENIKRYK